MRKVISNFFVTEVKKIFTVKNLLNDVANFS